MANIVYYTFDINGIKRNGKSITYEEYAKIMKHEEKSRRITGGAVLTFFVLRILFILSSILLLCFYIKNFKILLFAIMIILALLFKRKYIL